MNGLPNEIRDYYDSQVQGKLRGFVEGNDRVECAWSTIEQWAGEEPTRILEVGCGIGDIVWRMSQRWMRSHVVGLDVSQRSLRLAEALFGESRISFCEGPLVKGRLSGSFDLIVLMDVYEHIGVENRRELHEAIKELKNEHTRIVLAFPTPRHLAWLKIHQPNRIQPIDEDINIETMSVLAHDTGTDVLCYKEVGVWHEGDYAHAVLGQRVGWKDIPQPGQTPCGIMTKIGELFRRPTESLVPSRSERLARVLQRLGPDCYPSSTRG